MEQEEKKLLLADLSARLPYGVICTDNRHGDSRIFNIDIEDESVYYTDFDEYGLIENCKPYLRPMSSMSEDEKIEISKLLNYEFYVDYEGALVAEDDRHRIRIELMEIYIDWINSHHFDYRNLIDKNLAIKAPEDMYNIKKV